MTTGKTEMATSPRERSRQALQVARRLLRNGGHLVHRRACGPACENAATARAIPPSSSSRRNAQQESFLMFSPRNGHSRAVMELPAALVAAMIASGWLEERNGRWHLSPLGRRVAEGREPAELLAPDPASASHEIVERRHAPDGAARVFTMRQAETPLDWLARRRGPGGEAFLSPEEVEAAEIFRADYERARYGQRITMSWDATMTAGERRRMQARPGDPAAMADSVLAARERLRRALAALGAGLDEIVLEVVCLSRGLEAAERRLGWPRRAGKLALKLALARLARHYGLVRETAETRAARILAWALPDAHPTQALPPSSSSP